MTEETKNNIPTWVVVIVGSSVYGSILFFAKYILPHLSNTERDILVLVLAVLYFLIFRELAKEDDKEGGDE